jgi:hypothetical protein
LEVAEVTGVDYKRDNLEYVYGLKETAHNDAKELSPHFGTYKGTSQLAEEY